MPGLYGAVLEANCGGTIVFLAALRQQASTRTSVRIFMGNRVAGLGEGEARTSPRSHEDHGEKAISTPSRRGSRGKRREKPKTESSKAGEFFGLGFFVLSPCPPWLRGERAADHWTGLETRPTASSNPASSGCLRRSSSCGPAPVCRSVCCRRGSPGSPGGTAFRWPRGSRD